MVWKTNRNKYCIQQFPQNTSNFKLWVRIFKLLTCKLHTVQIVSVNFNKFEQFLEEFYNGENHITTKQRRENVYEPKLCQSILKIFPAK